MGRYNIPPLVDVVALEPDSVAVHAQMAVGFHKTRVDRKSGGVDHLSVPGGPRERPDGRDFSVLNPYVRDFGLLCHRVVDQSVFDTKHVWFLLLIVPGSFPRNSKYLSRRCL